jgi:hypothetical protein
MALVNMIPGPKVEGRPTLRRNPPANGPAPRRIPQWLFGDGDPGTTKSKLKDAWRAGPAAVDAVEDFEAQQRASGKFTDDGLRAEVRQFAVSQAAPGLYRNRRVIAAAKREAAERREKLVAPADKDSYAFAVRHRKLDLLLRLPQDERQAHFNRVDSLDPDITRAATELNLPAAVLGIHASTLDLIRERILRQVHGDALDAQEELEQAIQVAERTNEAAIAGLSHMVGEFDLGRFAQETAPHVRGAFWLKKVKDDHGAEVVQVFKHVDKADKWGYRWVDATPDEIADGGFYKNHAEWHGANGGQGAVP